ncbi:hypothetical protein Tco_1280105 [Tanacetum coccineum]
MSSTKKYCKVHEQRERGDHENGHKINDLISAQMLYTGDEDKQVHGLDDVVEDFGVLARPFDSHEDDTPDVLKSRRHRYFYYYANEEGNPLMGGLGNTVRI